MNTSNIEHKHLYIESSICHECYPEDKLKEIILCEMRKKEPDWSFDQSRPANDPLWIHYQWIIAQLEHRKCLVFDNEDMTIALCKEHLLHYVNQL